MRQKRTRGRIPVWILGTTKERLHWFRAAGHSSNSKNLVSVFNDAPRRRFGILAELLAPTQGQLGINPTEMLMELSLAFFSGVVDRRI